MEKESCRLWSEVGDIGSKNVNSVRVPGKEGVEVVWSHTPLKEDKTCGRAGVLHMGWSRNKDNNRAGFLMYAPTSCSAGLMLTL